MSGKLSCYACGHSYGAYCGKHFKKNIAYRSAVLKMTYRYCSYKTDKKVYTDYDAGFFDGCIGNTSFVNVAVGLAYNNSSSCCFYTSGSRTGASADEHKGNRKKLTA